MEHTDILKLGVPPYEEDSPDLAFIKLHSEDAGRFKARNTFKNLNRLKDNMLSEELSLKSGFIGISGEIAEWADEETNISDFHRVKGFGGLFGVSNVICSKECDGWDYIKCHVDFSPETELPNSYAGMSGGGLWNIVLAKQDGEINVTDCRLCGVVFRQSSVIDGGKRIVSCQGPLSVYSKLFQAVERQWPK